MSKPTPWYLMIAPEGEVTLDVLEAKTRPFYEAVQASGNITQAFAQTFAPDLKLFNCQGLFVRSLARYVAEYGSVRVIQERTELLATRSLVGRGIRGNRHALRGTRSSIKTKLKPNQALIDVYAKSFLIGRKPGLTFIELRRLVEAERRRKR